MRKNICKYVLFVCCLGCTCLAMGQELSKKNQDLISQNIIAYRFRYGQNWDLKLQNNQVLEKNAMFFKDLWPNEKDKLYLEVENIKINYPNDKFHFFHVKLRSLTFPSDTLRDEYHFIFLSGHDYIVGVNKLNDIPIFVSGDFFLSPYSSDFKLDKNLPESFYNYLYIRYFNLQITNISFYKRKNKHIFFYAYFNLQNIDRKIIISVNEDNFNDTKYRFKDKFSVTM